MCQVEYVNLNNGFAGAYTEKYYTKDHSYEDQVDYNEKGNRKGKGRPKIRKKYSR